MTEFHVQLYRLDAEGRTRPDGGEAIVEADDAAEAAGQVAGEPLTEVPPEGVPAEGRYAARVWAIVDYTAVSFDFFRP